MSQSYAFAEFRVIPSPNPQAQQRLGRRYILTVETALNSNNYRLTYSYGGSQRYLVMVPVWCADYDELLALMRQKIKQRIRHGYSLVAVSPNFPLHDWMCDQGYLNQNLNHLKVPVLQLFLPYFSLH